MEQGHLRAHFWQKLLIAMITICAAFIFTGETPVYAAEWYESYIYEKNDTAKTITLTSSKGSLGTSAVVPGSTTINGVVYKTILDNSGNNGKSLWSEDASTLTSLTIQSGVKATAGSVGLFRELSKLTTLDVSGLDTSAMTDMTYMFYNCSALTEIDLKSFDTSKVTNMRGMFLDCKKLKLVDVSSFNTSKVTIMSSMFRGNKALLYLDLSNFDTSNVTEMEYMFYACQNLTYLDVSSFNTSNVTKVASMCGGDSTNGYFGNGLKDLDIRNFDMSKMNNTYQRNKMFVGARMTNLYLPADNMLSGYDFSTNNNGYLFRIYYAGTQAQWDELNNTISSDMVLTCNYTKKNTPSQASVTSPATDTWYENYNYYIDKKNYKLVLLSSAGKMSTKGLTTLTVPAYTKINGIIYTTVLNRIDKTTCLWANDASNLKELTIEKGVELSDDCTNMFGSLSKLTTLNMNGVNTSNVVKMRNMFLNDKALISLDITGMDTSSVRNMYAMFSGCSALTSLDVTGFNTQNVTNMDNMFKSLKREDLDLRSFDMSNATTATMFGSANVTNLYLPVNAMKGFDFSSQSASGYSLSHIYYAGTEAQWNALGNTLGNKAITYGFTGDIPKKVTVTFNANGGSSVTPATKTVNVGDSYGELPTPEERVGYTFDGWYTSPSEGTVKSATDTVTDTADHTLFAHWTKTVDKAIITLDANGGSVTPTSIEVTVGGTYEGLPPEPKRDGYSFAGWYTNAMGGTQVTASTAVTDTSARTLYAHWSENVITVTVTFNANGGSVTQSSKTVTFGKTYGELPTPKERDGYTFNGWFTEANGGIKVTSESNVDNKSAHTLYAQWTEIITTVTVSLVPGSGGNVSPSTVTFNKGAVYGSLPTPTKENYKFEGWYTEENGGTQITSTTTLISDSAHTLYARWTVSSYTISFDSGDGSVDPTYKKVNIGENYGELPTPTLKDYTFAGWYADSQYSDKITESAIVALDGPRTLYALWVQNTLSVTFYAYQGASVKTGEYVVGSAYGELPEAPARSGYKFDGWFTDPNDGEEITKDTIVTAQEAQMLYAHWTKTTLDIKFNANGGTVSSAGKNVTIGSAYGELPIPTKDNYKFKGWYTSLTGGTQITDETIVESNDSTTLYAQWTEIQVYVTFNGNGDGVTNVPVARKVTVGQTYGEIADPERNGYKFDGWYTSATEGTIVKGTDVVEIEEAHTLYAHWTRTSLDIIFNPNGGMVSTGSKGVIIGKAYGELPIPSKTNYKFKGWYTAVTGGTEITEGTVAKSDDSTVLYAQWMEMQVYVTFDGNGDGVTKVPATRKVTVGQVYDTIADPERSGYRFDGWYTSAIEGTKVTGTDVVAISEAHTLYAHWTRISLDITFNPNGGVVSTVNKNVVIGKAYGELPTPTKDNYKFKGWYTAATGGTAITADTVVKSNDNTTLYAQWTEIEVYVTFDGNGDGVTNVPVARKVTVGKAYDTIADPERSGYRFDGWYTSPSEGTKVTGTNIVTISEAHTLYAHWTRTSLDIIFNPNGGTVSTSSRSVIIGQTYGGLPVPNKSNFKFKGWYTAATGGTEITAETVAKSDDSTVLYAQWTEIQVYVTFDGNGDGVTNVPVARKVTVGQAYDTIEEPKRSGYSFNGWYTSATEGTVVKGTDIVAISEAHTLYAHWTRISLDIIFNPNGGTVSTGSKNVTIGEEYGDLPVPVKDKYTFKGWYTSATDGTEVTKDTKVKNDDKTTLFALWEAEIENPDEEKSVSVTFDGNGDGVTGLPLARLLTIGQPYGAMTIPERSGYKFDGWYTAAVGGREITATDNVENEEAHILYAHWTKTTLIVQFNPNNGAVAIGSKSVTIGEKYGDLPIPTRENYNFKGWFTSVIGGTEVTKDTIVKGDDSTVLYAQWTEVQVNVTFNGNGDGVSNVPVARKVTIGNPYGTIEDPERSGYKFDGWYTSATEGNKVIGTDNVVIEEAHTLYAHWTKLTLDISFNPNGGEVSTKSKTVTVGSTYGELPVPVRDNYIFVGWYTEVNGGTGINHDTTVKSDDSTILYALWREEQVTVSFEGNGYGVTNIPSSKTVTVGKPYGTIEKPERSGYEFAGWYTESEGGTKISETDKVEIEEAHTLYAHWTKSTLDITFNPNGGTVSIDSKSVTVGLTYGELPVPVRDNYIFVGWYTELAWKTKVDEKTTAKSDDSTILYARWREKQITISFEGNGDGVTNVPVTKTVIPGQNYGEMAEPVRSGYKFVGWYTESEGGTKVSETDKVEIEAAHSLYAHWTKNALDITFNPNGGTVETESITVTVGLTYGELPIPKRDNYRFVGWFTEVSGENKISADTTVKSDDSTILYAIWKEVNVTISFEGNGDNVINIPDSKTVTVGKEYGVLGEPAQSGYDFAGWYTEAVGGELITSEHLVEIEETHILYAHWIEREKTVMILFHANRGEVEVGSMEVVVDKPYGENGKLPVPTREGYMFDGWYTSPTGGEQVTDETIVTNENIHTLYAQWFEKDKKVRVSFNSNGGECRTGSKDVYVGLLYGELPDATRDGYIFMGWYTASEGGSLVTADTKVRQRMAHTLYAQWKDEKVKVMVSFNANGGNLATAYKEVVFDEAYGPLPIPTREGYIWEGWFTETSGGERITKESVVTNENTHTLYAQWININDKITVVFNADGGGLEIESKDIVVGREYGELPIPVKEGYTFAGWYTEAEDGELITAESVVSIQAAHTLYARWVENKVDNPTNPDKQSNQDGQQQGDTPQTPLDPASQPGVTDPSAGTDVPVPVIPEVNTVIADPVSGGSYKVTSNDPAAPAVTYKGTNNKKAKTVTVPETVTIDGITYAVTKVDTAAFKNNKKVTKIVIGKNVTSISKNAFKNCKKIKTIVIKTTKLTNKTLAKGAFKGITKKTVIKVPKKKLSAYKKLFRSKGLSKKVKVKKG